MTALALDALSEPGADALPPVLLPHRLPENRGRYSLGRALGQLADPSRRHPVDGLEGEVSQEIGHRMDRPATGLYIPWDVEVRTLSTATGAGAIPVIVDRTWLDILRAKTLVARLGAITLPGLAGMGGYQLPRKTSASLVGWVGEGVDVNNSNPVIADQVVYTPHTCGALCDYTRRMFLSSPEFEAQLINDLSTSLSVELDRIALAGQAGGPAGVLGDSSVPTVDLSAGLSRGAIAGLLEVLGKNSGDNAEPEFIAWVTSPGGRKSLQLLDNVAGGTSGRFVWERNEVLGYRAESTAQVPDAAGATSLIVGNWSDLNLAIWSLGADVIINPYRFASTGFLRVTALMDVDARPRREKSFAIGTGLATT